MEEKKFNSRIASVKWKEITIGYLVKDQAGYLFKYDGDGIQNARGQGYLYLIGFKNLKQIYQSNQLFPVFKSRIPSKQRRDIDKILDELGLKNYDEFEILLAKKGKTNTDFITVEEEFDREKMRKIMEHSIVSKKGFRGDILRESLINAKMGEKVIEQR